MLFDNHGRRMNYLRLSVTDNCNLRCHYCMPNELMHFARTSDLMTWEEMLKLTQVFVKLGVDKIRITGGEPFARKGVMIFLEELTQLPDLKNISLTTNATLIGPYLNALKDCGISQVNVSLDSMNQQRFYQITRRDYLNTVLGNIYRMLDMGFEVKINCVVMNTNIEDIVPLVYFANEHHLTVRFLEEMPFNGRATGESTLEWTYIKILEHIKAHFSEIERLPTPINATATNYRVMGEKGTFGIIPSFSRTFCSTCNRIRVSAKGELQTCLYSTETTNLRAFIPDAEELTNQIQCALSKRHKTGFDAENHSIIKKSMSVLGG